MFLIFCRYLGDILKQVENAFLLKADGLGLVATDNMFRDDKEHLKLTRAVLLQTENKDEALRELG
jgi:hypothetical protein